MASKRLNQFTAYATHADGSHGNVKMHMNIETSGDLQLFIELPEHLLSSGVATGMSLYNKTLHVSKGRLYGRDPTAIKETLDGMFGAYKRLLLEQKKEKVIAVAMRARVPGDHANNNNYDFSFVSHEFVLALDIEVYWQSEGKLYVYEEGKDTSALRHAHKTVSGAKLIPYTDESWAALTSIRETLMAGTRRLRDMLQSDELPQLLLQGRNALLGVDTAEPNQ